VAAHIAPDYQSDEAPAASKTAAKKTPTNQPRRDPEPSYQRVSQLVAVEGDHVLAASDDRLIITAAKTAEPPRPPAEARPEPRKESAARDDDYLETQRRDAEALWGARSKAGRADAPGVAVNPAL